MRLSVRKIFTRPFLLVLFAMQASTPVDAGSQASACETSPQLVGKCFIVHGRLSSYNGNPGFRIWHIGTKHLLGVLDDAGSISDDLNSLNLSSEIEERLRSHLDEIDIYGDYTVCPFEAERSGWMQDVCIAHADHLVAVPRR